MAHVIQAPPCPFTGPPPTIGTAISPNGRWVVGYYFQCAVSYDEAFAFDTLTGQFVTIPRPSGVYSASAKDVGDNGLVVGTCLRSGIGDRAFAYDLTNGTWTDIPAQNPNQGWSTGMAINSSNIICGTRSIDDGGDPVNPRTAYIYDLANGQFTDLGLINGFTTSATDINDAGAVSGQMVQSGLLLAFIWENGLVRPLPTLAGLETTPWAINNYDQVVGQSLLPYSSPPPTNVNHAFLWNDGALIDLGTLPGHGRSVANALDDAGLVVGRSRPAQGNGDDRAVIWHKGAIADLNVLLVSTEFFELTGAGGIDKQGRIISSGYNADVDIVTVILEPLDVFADLDANCAVGVTDLLIVISEWGAAQSPADLNSDGIVSAPDLFIVIENWTF